MPGTVSDGPSVSMSFANNFWGKEDAGVEPLLTRMQNAKQTCDELKSFYTARAAIEDEYARKLLALSRKPLGAQEAGSLRTSMDVLRGEVEGMGKAHQTIAAQMKTELDEPLAAFAGAMKERRKIVQGGIEKLLKVKVQQTQQVNKTRDKYEQECLKIKGYLAQGHMVMGQEERKNKAKLEKTQINLATSNTDYENAVKILEETTGRWNRDWKAAADKFQDLEEERLDFMKSSLWSYANIASTVCVSDDAACEKVRLSLENCEVEKDIMSFIKERGTGQEIPDPPKYINFCRGDVSDSASETSEDDSYSVAQFQRTINPAYRSSSPAPSTLESHHAPHSAATMELLNNPPTPQSRETTVTPQTQRSQQRVEYQQPSVNVEYDNQPERLDFAQSRQPRQLDYQKPSIEQDYQQPQKLSYGQAPKPDYQRQQSGRLDLQQQPRLDYQSQGGRPSFDQTQRGALAQVPHDPYPLDGMTMLCRTGPPSERSSAHSPVKDRPSSREDNHSDYSNPTSFSSMEPPSGKNSPTKQVAPAPEKQVAKKKSGFFNSPFRRKSQKEKENPVQATTPSSRNTWSARTSTQNTPSRRPGLFTGDSRQNMLTDRPSGSPEPVDPRASFQLNVGNNVFDVATPDRNNKALQKKQAHPDDALDPIAQALAELNDQTKASSTRISADNYHGVASPAPHTAPLSRPGGSQMVNSPGPRSTPPPSYDQPVQRLGLPQPAFTAKAMQQTRQKYVDQTQNVFGGHSRSDSQMVGYGQQPQSRPGTRGSDMPRATSPAPPRGTSPRPSMQGDPRQQARSVSPNPYGGSQHGSQYGGSQRSRTQSYSPQKRGSDQHFRHNSPGDVGRSVSPNPYAQQERPGSSHVNSDMAVQLAPIGDDGYGSKGRGGSRAGNHAGGRPQSSYYGNQQQQLATRTRSKSVADVRQFNSQGRPILHFARAMYVYQAAIPEELSFAKGDVLAVLRLQDDGWWEAEIAGKNGRPGLVPSNYLQNC